MNRWIGLLAVVACIGACATSWPRVTRSKGQPTAENYLLRIEALTHGSRPEAYYKKILLASANCRTNSHDERVSRPEHCRLVQQAYLQARAGKWEKCLLYLSHPVARSLAEADQWPDYPPGSLESALDLLLEISELLDRAPDPDNPDNEERKTIHERIAACSDAACVGYGGGGATRDNAEHYTAITNARDSAMANNWDQCSNELEHMLGQ